MHKLVIIGSLEENVPLVKKSKERGYYTIVCDGYPNGVAKKYADKSYDINVRETDKIAKMCIDEQVDGIVGSFSDLVLEMITEIADKAGLPWYMKPDQIEYYRDKSSAKKIMRECGIAVPKNRHIDSSFKESDIEGLRFPLVIKPNSGWGSKGIKVLDSKEQLITYFDSNISSQSGFIIEEYMDGKEHNTISWVVDGKVNIICIGDRNKNPRQGDCIPTLNRVVYPSNQFDELYPQVKDVLQRFVNRTNQKTGPLCMQFFYNQNGVEVCEIAGRILGHEHQMISYYSGIDICDLLLDMVYDNDSVVKKLDGYVPAHSPNVAGLYFLCENNCLISDMSVAEEYSRLPFIIDYHLYYEPNEVVDNNGYRSYFAKYFIKADERETLDKQTSMMFDKWHIYSKNQCDIAHPFVLEK